MAGEQFMSKKNVAVVLCGSGFKDGSEIREAVAVLWALSQHPVHVQCFAPDAEQTDVVNCLTGQIDSTQSRNMLVESARIARGNVLSLSTLDLNQCNALILPGGYGAAKNLCTFAKDGKDGEVCSDLSSILLKMHEDKKPIGAVCIAPVILAMTFKDKHFSLTVGKFCSASEQIEALGHKHVHCEVEDCVTDIANRIVTTPAYMYDDADLHKVFSGIHKLVDDVVRLIV